MNVKIKITQRNRVEENYAKSLDDNHVLLQYFGILSIRFN